MREPTDTYPPSEFSTWHVDVLPLATGEGFASIIADPTETSAIIVAQAGTQADVQHAADLFLDEAIRAVGDQADQLRQQITPFDEIAERIAPSYATQPPPS